MEFVEDLGFGQAYIMFNGHYLICFPDSTIEEFDNKRDYHAYVRRMKKHLGVEISPPEKEGDYRRLRRIDD